MNSNEKLKQIPGFDAYMVSDTGDIYRNNKDYGYIKLSKYDGKYVTLCKKGIKQKAKIAYIVARTFIPNTELRPYVIHKDGDIENNNVNNLQWSERKEILYIKNTRKILQYDRNFHLIGEYESIKSASENTYIHPDCIRKCIRGKTKTSGGYIWKSQKTQ